MAVIHFSTKLCVVNPFTFLSMFPLLYAVLSSTLKQMAANLKERLAKCLDFNIFSCLNLAIPPHFLLY